MESKNNLNNEIKMDNDDDVVISGISGRFPESDNVDELCENLFKNVDMITEDERRWPIDFYGLPSRTGKMKDLSKFDAQFFGVHGKQANNMDPQARLLLELTYEAIADAGINPQHLRGTRTGVYIGASSSEVEEAFVQDVTKASGYALTGCSRSMFANRVSFTFDLQGPSYTMDTACSSSFIALQQAYLAIRSNECDQAIVGGVNICVRPATSIQFQKLNILSPDGKCHHLDADANGHVRSETCSVIFLQRKSAAKRIYATVIHAKTNTDGNKPEGITHPSCQSQMDVMRQTVQEAGIDPLSVNYVEAHGIGTQAGDPVETKAIAEVFCQGRTEPLLIGSVKTNLGHAEPAAGMNSVAKVLLTFQNKMIPANLHYKTPNQNIPELANGKVRPVLENTPYQDGIVAINCFGYGGVNVHVLLKPHQKELAKHHETIVHDIPRLILATGRTDDSVAHIFDFIEKNPDKVNAEFLALLQEIAMTGENSGMNSRGYMIADKHPDGQTVFPKETVRVSEKRPVWFIYSGMGSQWTSMAKGLMSLDIFRESIQKSADILKDYDIDLMHLVMSDDDKCLETMVAPFVAIASIQIALTDLLRKLGIEPDGIVGHSVGELGCAYADGAFNHEQMLLAAYWRGKCVEEAVLPKGLMAAVGLSWEEAKARCPEGVVPACHNSQDSVTISGEYNAAKQFVEQLRNENIFAREVKSCGVSFHSYYMEAIAPELLKKLEQLLPEPKLRTNRWISSSVPESRWNEDTCRYSAPYYYVNNLKSPVLFHEAVQHVPKNAILIEIAPHCLLQPVVKRTLGADVSYVTLMKRNNNEGNLNLLLSAIGKMYTLGINPDITVLYPKVEFPVSRNIQSLSSLIKWDHSQSWLVTLYPEYFNPNNLSDYSIKIDLNEKSDQFYVGHCIDGRIMFPATGYLYLAWQMLSKTKGQFCEKTMVEFENVTMHRATILHKETPVKFEIRLMEVTGEFTISESGTIVVTGRVFVPEKSSLKLQSLLTDGSVRSNSSIRLYGSDIYKELRLHGYDYGPSFQVLAQSSVDSKLGKVKYNNWVTLADAMLQMNILGKNSRGLYLPVRIQSIRCDPKVLFEAVEQASQGDGLLDIVNDERIQSTVVPGLEIQGLKVNLAPRRPGSQQKPVLENYRFTPFHQTNIDCLDNKLEEYISVLNHLANQLIELYELKSFTKIPKKVDEAILKHYLIETSSDDYPLISTLKTLLTDQTKIESQEDILDSEMIWTAVTSQPYLGVLIDLVMENVQANRMLDISEVNPTTGRCLAESVRRFVGVRNGEYTLFSSKPTSNVNHIAWNETDPIPPSALATNSIDLFVYKHCDSYNPEAFLQYSHKFIKDNGFLLAMFRQQKTLAEQVLDELLHKNKSSNLHSLDHFKDQANKLGFRLISERSDLHLTGSSLLLFRKNIEPETTSNQPAIIHVTNTGYNNWIPELKTKLAQLQTKKSFEQENIWLVGSDQPNNGLLGMVQCLRQEPGGERIRCMLHSPLNQQDKLPEFSLDNSIYQDIIKNDLVVNVYRDGQFGSYRHYQMKPLTKIQTEHAYLNVSTRGDLSSLQWFEAQHKNFRPEISKGQSLYTVYYAPLNFRDVMLATGKLPSDSLPGDLAQQDCILGMEFAGRDQNRRRVMGMVPAKGLATTLLIDDDQHDFIWPIPENWTMEQASTVPVVYSTAYYALVVRGELEPGESVLIHSGSGGVGQAAISICLSMGCRVYTTVGSEEKRNYLKKMFPELTDRNIANSRDTSFEQHVLRETNGRGVDLVLNSLSDEKLQASVRCLAQHGRFLEIGKYDLTQNNPLGMSAFLRNITFCGILLDALMVSDSNESALVNVHRRMVSKLMKDGIKSGAVRPLKINVFELNEAVDAFRFMASGKHIGKVVLKIRSEEEDEIMKPGERLVWATSRTVLLPDKSYIVTGGLGGFGLELTRWLVQRNARYVVLNSRNGPIKPYQKKCLKWLEENDVHYEISTDDITTVDGCKSLLQKAKKLAPVGGVFHLAMVLSDALFENQTPESFENVCKAKVSGIENLDKLTREHCPNLDYFVAFSSMVCGRGNPGQSNYAFANSSMERVCELRHSQGLPALAVQWGAVGDVGVLAENAESRVISGTIPQRMESCLSVLDQFLQQKEQCICCSHVPTDHYRYGSKTTNNQDLITNIANILDIKQIQSIKQQQTLADLGMDSLMAEQIKQLLEKDYETIYSVSELASLTIERLKNIEQNSAARYSQSQQTTPATSA